MCPPCCLVACCQTGSVCIVMLHFYSIAQNLKNLYWLWKFYILPTDPRDSDRGWQTLSEKYLSILFFGIEIMMIERPSTGTNLTGRILNKEGLDRMGEMTHKARRVAFGKAIDMAKRNQEKTWEPEAVMCRRKLTVFLPGSFRRDGHGGSTMCRPHGSG